MIPNAAKKRFKHVVDTYGPSKRPLVVFDTAAITAQLMGLDHLERDIRHLRHDYESALFGPRSDRQAGKYGPGKPYDPAKAALKMGELQVLMERTLPEHHRFETLIPWFARELSRIQKGPITWTVTGPDLEEAGAPWAEPEPFSMENEYDTAVQFLKESGTAIGQYVTEEKVDLTKFSVDDARTAAASYVSTAASSGADGAEVVYTFPDLYTVQRLTTLEQTRAEGTTVQHCVGEYKRRISPKGEPVFVSPHDPKEHGMMIFSLRDAFGNPHVTMEWNTVTGRWGDILGKQNKTPAEKYQPYLKEFVENYFPDGKRRDAEAFERFEIDEGAGANWVRHYGVDFYDFSRQDMADWEDGDAVPWRDLVKGGSGNDIDRPFDGIRFVVVPYTGGESTLAQANRRAIRSDFDDHPGLHETDGGEMLVRIDRASEPLLEVINSLEGYPVYDDEVHDEVEEEAKDAAWDSWGQYDFKRAIGKEAGDLDGPEDDPDVVLDWLESEYGDFRGFFESMRERANEEWVEDGNEGDMYVRVEDVLEKVEVGAYLLGQVVDARYWANWEPEALERVGRALQQLTAFTPAPDPDAIVAHVGRTGQLTLPFESHVRPGLLRSAARSLDEELRNPDKCAAYCALSDAWIVLSEFHRQGEGVEDGTEALELLAKWRPYLDQVRPVVKALYAEDGEQ